MEKKLIVAVCGHPALYDTAAVLYWEKIKKEEAWVKVREEAGLPGKFEAICGLFYYVTDHVSLWNVSIS